MPTYEYRCPSGHHFERFQKISDEPKADCPTCGAAGERLLSGGAGFLLKGDGFYATDYRSDSYKKEASKEGAGGTPDSDSGTKDAPKKEAASSSKPETAPKDSGSAKSPPSEGA